MLRITCSSLVHYRLLLTTITTTRLWLPLDSRPFHLWSPYYSSILLRLLYSLPSLLELCPPQSPSSSVSHVSGQRLVYLPSHTLSAFLDSIHHQPNPTVPTPSNHPHLLASLPFPAKLLSSAQTSLAHPPSITSPSTAVDRILAIIAVMADRAVRHSTAKGGASATDMAARPFQCEWHEGCAKVCYDSSPRTHFIVFPNECDQHRCSLITVPRSTELQSQVRPPAALSNPYQRTSIRL